MTADGLTIVFGSSRKGGQGDRDMWMATRESSEAAWSEPFNLGTAINTDRRESYPVLSPDGLLLMFTRASDGNKTFVSTRSSSSAPWSQAVPNEYNKRAQISPDLTPDGLTFLVTRSMPSANGVRSHDLWISRRSSRQTPWSDLTPVGFPVNTDDDEESGTISDDGRLLIFQRTVLPKAEDEKSINRLWMANRTGWDAPWSEPVPFRPLDTSIYDGQPRLLPDGKSLLISSQLRDESIRDIWLVKLVRKQKDEESESAADLLATGEWEWQIQEPLGPNINSPRSEWGADMTADGLTLVFSSERDGGLSKPDGEFNSGDLWMVNRSSTEEPWSRPVNLGAAINTGGREVSPTISPDGLTLNFTRLYKGGKLMTATRPTITAPWSEAVDWDKGTLKLDANPELAHDGLTLLSSKIRKKSTGEKLIRDIWVGRRSSLQEPWSESMLTPLAAPVSTDKSEGEGTLSEDGRLLFFTRTIVAKPQKNQIFMATRDSWDAPWLDPVPFAAKDLQDGRAPRLLPGGKALLFISHRPGGEGRLDIWLAKLVRKPDLNPAAE